MSLDLGDLATPNDDPPPYENVQARENSENPQTNNRSVASVNPCAEKMVKSPSLFFSTLSTSNFSDKTWVFFSDFFLGSRSGYDLEY